MQGETMGSWKKGKFRRKGAKLPGVLSEPHCMPHQRVLIHDADCLQAFLAVIDSMPEEEG